MEEYGFEVEIITNEEASRRNIKHKLRSLFEGDNELVVFYFAGHGMVTDMESHLVTHDHDDIDYGIDLTYFKRLSDVKLTEESQALITLDCCHSGSAEVRTGEGVDTDGQMLMRPLKNEDIRSAVGQLSSGRALLASCRPDESAFEEPSLDHGLFTYHLLQGLYGQAADRNGKMKVSRLYTYVSDKLDEVSQQSPVFKGGMTGSIILGEGLEPIESSNIDIDRKRRIENEAVRLINQHNSIYNVDVDKWKLENYEKACSKLKPIIGWFSRKAEQYPSLDNSGKFSSARSTAKSHIERLANLEVGLSTQHGKVVDEIGSGKFGSVWKISSEKSHKAYKVFHSSDLSNETKKNRFQRGFEAMDQLSHPHIVDVYKFTRCPVGFTMDYIDGPNLRNYAPMKTDPSTLLSQLITVADTLRHTHSRGVLHRDVKPANIIISYEGEDNLYKPHLTDFDLAWFDTATKFTTQALGTMIYAAPEQLSKPHSKSSRSPKVDIYSFGQLLYFIIVGGDPTLHANNERALTKAVEGWVLKEPAEKIIEIYRDTTQNNPANRPSTFQSVSDRLFEIKKDVSKSKKETKMEFDKFSEQVAFSLVGLSKERIKSPTHFVSTSGRTDIKILNELPEKVVFKLEPLSKLRVDGCNSFEEARDAINKQVDHRISSLSSVKRRSPKRGPFKIILEIKNISTNMEGVEQCRHALTRSVDAIENT